MGFKFKKPTGFVPLDLTEENVNIIFGRCLADSNTKQKKRFCAISKNSSVFLKILMQFHLMQKSLIKILIKLNFCLVKLKIIIPKIIE